MLLTRFSHGKIKEKKRHKELDVFHMATETTTETSILKLNPL